MEFNISQFVRRRTMALVCLLSFVFPVFAQEPFGSSKINDGGNDITDSVPSAFQDKLMLDAYSPEFSAPLPESRFTNSTFSRMMSSVQPPKPSFMLTV